MGQSSSKTNAVDQETLVSGVSLDPELEGASFQNLSILNDCNRSLLRLTLMLLDRSNCSGFL